MLEELRAYTLKQYMELRRTRWLEKLAHMTESRNPRRLLVAWTPKPRLAGKQHQTIGHGYSRTIEENLKIENSTLHGWMPMAKHHELWATHIEEALELKGGTNKKYKLRR